MLLVVEFYYCDYICKTEEEGYYLEQYRKQGVCQVQEKMDSSSSPSKKKEDEKRLPSIPATRAASIFSRRYVIGLVIFVVILISGVVTVRLITNTFDPFFVVASDSMVPTLQVGDDGSGTACSSG